MNIRSTIINAHQRKWMGFSEAIPSCREVDVNPHFLQYIPKYIIMSLKIFNRTDIVWFKDLENSIDSEEVGHNVDGTSKAAKSAFTDWRCYELICRMETRPFMLQLRVVTRPQQNFCWRLVLRSWREITWVHVCPLLEIQVTFVTAGMESFRFAVRNYIFPW